MSPSLSSVVVWVSALVAAGSCTPRAPLSTAQRGGGPPALAQAVAPAPRGAPRGELSWADFSPETFARAKAQRRLIILDGSAEWCHWCHVMEAETYHDPRVRALIEQHFIAVKVDVDARPDIEERYGDYGWPATVLFSADGQELGKFRGFLEADRFLEILRAAAAGAAEGDGPAAAVATEREVPARSPLSRELVDAIAHIVAVELEDYWDPRRGGWGVRQKAPVGANNAWLLSRAARGDAEARRRALFTLEQQAQLIDPVWGGIYQYSDSGTWDRPHYEKLMSYQAPALDNYARAYALTNDPAHLARARAMHGYLDRFLKSPHGAFFGTQDADLNAHDPGKPFVAGRDYYALGQASRLALGVPRVDRHEYGEDSGQAIAAYVTYFEVTREPEVLAAAEKAARRILETHADPRGGITHDLRKDGPAPEVLFLADNAAFGLALMRLFEATGRREYLEPAIEIGRFMMTELAGDVSGGLYASTRDPAAVGVFAVRREPFEDNVRALRFLLRLCAASPQARAELAPRLPALVRSVTRPQVYKASGRFLGELLLALDELRELRELSEVIELR